jgi:hypothetical protein|tara:strand:- start:145 stop:504 length:360 start_codon:yes stop_codon:yes gene_type:complete
VSEIDVELHPRRAGTSKYTGLFRIGAGIIDLVSVWFLLLFSRKPLILFGFTGMALITLGIVVGVVAFILRFGTDSGSRLPLYLVILLETVGFLLFGFGLIAEMIAQLREDVDSLRRGDR